MSTVREQIINAAMAAMNADRPAGVPECTRVSALSFTTKALPKFSLYPVKEEVQRINRGAICRRTFTLRIECQAGAMMLGPEPVDAMVDSMLAHATSTLAGNELGGLVNSIEEVAVEWDFAASDTVVVGAIIDFVVDYQTLHNDQTRQ